ncbi:MAG TPA: RNA polymerase factor sigma-54 [Bauldia sp.]|nr:RNA polymerase factor sigma-54 [Bauldia sp.]
MALSHKLELRQSQSLVMTPQLMQAIKLLQLSNLDLVAYVEAELERNPLLERAEAEESGDSDGAAERPDDTAARDALETDDWQEAAFAGGDRESAGVAAPGAAAADPPEPANPRADGPTVDAWTPPARQSPATGDDYNLEAFVAEERSLADRLVEQLGLATADPSARLIGQQIITEIDETGYFRGEVAEIAERLGAPPAEVEATLALIQAFDPPGVGARNLAECLAIQLRERNRLDPAMQALLAHLDLLARRDMAALTRICGVDAADLADMIAEIRALDPKPGNAYGNGIIQPVVPDVTVRPALDGSWIVELNSSTLPRVLINQSYYAKVARSRKTDTDKAYIADCLQTANWLVKSLDQRAKTILKVATEIVRQQDGFLAEGVQHLRPLNLKTVAEAIGMHESTVSRVTSNKYMATPRGIFEMKYFFTASIAAAGGGEAHSAEAVRYRIRRLIDDEAPDDVLSDDTIVKVLRGSGIDIARRTVAKYREAMRIPSSVQRRREKLAGG